MPQIRKYLRRRFGLFAVFFQAAASLLLVVQSPLVRAAAIIDSARDVELTFVDEKLLTLAFSQGQWRTYQIDGQDQLLERCTFKGKSWLTYDKRAVISMTRSAVGSRIVVSHPRTCVELVDTVVTANVHDADVQIAAKRIVISAREAGRVQLLLFSTDGEHLARLGFARNAELGFSPDGNTVINFDHAGSKASLWRARDGASQSNPFDSGVDLIFAPESPVVFSTRPGRATRHSGLLGDAQPLVLSGDEVIRNASRFGASIVVQAPNLQQPAFPNLRLIDLASNASVALGSGHIDAVAMDSAGTEVAVAIRAPRGNRVTISRVKAAFTP